MKDCLNRFPVGTQFIRKGRTCTVVDVYTTRNLAGHLVRIRYVATHEFMGQIVQEYDLTEPAVAMGLLS